MGATETSGWQDHGRGFTGGIAPKDRVLKVNRMGNANQNLSEAAGVT